ncbi:MAG: M28 family peptidase [Deltaproteobacteria bacterium]|nr:M28 family peptidase [Nannocystaceae bacterium]
MGTALAMFVSAACVPPTINPAEPWPTPAAVDDDGPDGFSGTHAFTLLERWLAAPRSLGDARRQASIDALVDELARTGATIERIDHAVVDPLDGRSYALTEIVAHLRPDATRRFVLATHFDTRPWADEEPDPALHGTPVPGANDGTSGLAVVLALVPPLLARLPEHVGVSIVLFDGEELGHPEDAEGGYCMGSRHLATRIRDGAHPLLAAAELGIVLDMVGDRDLHVLAEPGSRTQHPQLVEHLWQTAAGLGITAFDPEPRGRGIVDDHKFLGAAGIPSVLLIDREYVAWHRTDDTLDKVSAQSLDAVGDVVLRGLLTWFAAG